MSESKILRRIAEEKNKFPKYLKTTNGQVCEIACVDLTKIPGAGKRGESFRRGRIQKEGK